MASVRASTRVSIKWKDGEAYEDTDTLVLTIHDFSLDLRVFVSGEKKGTIDWATVAKVSEKAGSTKENPILTWEHIIDSRPPTGVEDSGVFESLPNGDVTETGRMFNPTTGEIEDYIETWRRYPSSASEPYVVLQLQEAGVIGYLGRVGSRALGLGKLEDGSFVAWRDDLDAGKRVYQMGQTEPVLPALPATLPREWSQGEMVELGGKLWVVRWVGHH